MVSSCLKFATSSGEVEIDVNVRGCLHDTGATFILGRDEKLHRVYKKLCLNDVYEINHMWTADMKSNEGWSSQLWTQFYAIA